MLRWRLLVATIILVPLISLLILDYRCNFGLPGVWLWPLVLALSGLAVAEVLDLLQAKDWQPARWSVYSGTLLVVLAALVPAGLGVGCAQAVAACRLTAFSGTISWPLLALALCVPLVFLGEMRRFRGPGKATVHVALGLFTIVYVGLQLTFLIALRSYHGNAWGMAAVISVLVVTKMADTGAYFTGKSLGRHKLTPVLSPKKTVEGGVGGVVVACICSWVYFQWLVPLLVGSAAPVTPWWGSLTYGAVLAVLGTVGDLCESLLKRDMERKDSSRWMPGLGGILDVLDSLLVTAPTAYLCWALGLVGP